MTKRPMPSGAATSSGHRADWTRWAVPRLLELASRTALLLVVAALCLHCWRMRHIPALGTDSLIYHLTLPAAWMQVGYLGVADLPFHDSAAEHSPMLFQSLVYGLMRITGDAGLVWTIQPVFLALMYLLLYRSARLLGSGKRLAMAFTAVFVFHLPFLNNAPVANNDIVLTCGCALFLYGLLCMQFRFERGAVVAAGGLALMLATKMIGVVYAGAGILVLVVIVVDRALYRRETIRWMHLLGPTIGLLVLGSAFHLRNLIVHGNPLYPASIQLFGVPLFGGLYDTSVLVDHHWRPRALAQMLVDDDEVFALRIPLSILLWLGLVASALLIAVKRRSRTTVPRLGACVIFPLLAVVFYFSVTPFWREHRLLFPLHYGLWLCLAHALAGIVAISSRARTFIEVGILCVFACLAWLTGANQTWMLLSIGVAGIAAGMMYWRRLCRRMRPAALGVVGIAVAAIALAGPWWYPGYRAARRAVRPFKHEEAYGARGHAWNLAETFTVNSRGRTIAYAGTPIVFPLYGSRLQNRVCYVPLSPEDRPTPVKLEAGDSVTRNLAVARRKHVDEDYWLAGLAQRGVELLYLSDRPDYGGVAQELHLVARHPERFMLVFYDEGTYLYVVRTR